ncbi:MAG: YaaR family protein [Spirochaetales bacterium]|nr:YaaR family protein [Spirochaetales bacterium]MBP7265028.1 YaaR family protein [Spirochaetia bacterium]
MAALDGANPITAASVAAMSGKKPERKKEAQKAKLFGTALREAERADSTPAAEGQPFSHAEAAELLDAVTVAGELLKRDATTDAIKGYKKAVRDFVHYVVERAYDVDEHVSGRSVLKRKKFTTVTVIDEKLERLAADVLSAQRDKLDILRRLDEIHGLLVDLLR